MLGLYSVILEKGEIQQLLNLKKKQKQKEQSHCSVIGEVRNLTLVSSGVLQ